MIQGIFTTLLLVVFLAIVVWAFSRHKKRDFEDAANIPFLDEDENPGKKESGDNRNG